MCTTEPHTLYGLSTSTVLLAHVGKYTVVDAYVPSLQPKHHLFVPDGVNFRFDGRGFPLRGRSVDLARCSSWLKFCEVHEDDRSTVIFLCGGGVRVAEVSEASMGGGVVSGARWVAFWLQPSWLLYCNVALAPLLALAPCFDFSRVCDGAVRRAHREIFMPQQSRS